MTKENNKQTRVVIRKPSWFLYSFVGFILTIVSKILFRLKIDNKKVKDLKEPFVVIGNHASVLDIVFAVGALLPHRLNILTSRDLFSWKAFKPFINRLGCIPKNQGSSDIKALRTMKYAIEQGRNLIVYPEGKTSIEGKGLHYIAPSIAKLLKYLDATVVLSYVEGAYLAKPRYYKGFRYNKAKVTASVLLTREQLRTLSNDEIYDIVRKALVFNDNIYQQKNHISFRSKRPAEGLDYILYKCPKCLSEYHMKSTAKLLICESCQNTVEYTKYGELIPHGDSKTFDRIDLWYDFQREWAEKDVSDPNFSVAKQVDFWLNTDVDFFNMGSGTLTMDRVNITYTGTKDGEPFTLSTPLYGIASLITKNEEGVDIIQPDGIYRFLFTDGPGAIRMGLHAEQLFRITHNLTNEW